jgi:hypothetical protein
MAPYLECYSWTSYYSCLTKLSELPYSERSNAKVQLLKHGGHNKILSEVQVEAIYKYIEDSYLSGYGVIQ